VYVAHAPIRTGALFSVADLSIAFRDARHFAAHYNVTVTVTNDETRQSVNIRPDGTVQPHTHGGPFTFSTCNILNCGSN